MEKKDIQKKESKEKNKNSIHENKDNSSTERTESKKIGILLLLFAGIGIALLLWVTVGTEFPSFFEGDKVAVTVNGVEITEEDIATEMSKLPPYYLAAGIDQETLRAAILDQLIAKTLLLEEAEKADITATEQEINDVITNLTISSALTEEELIERLNEENMTINDLKRLIEEQLILNKLIDQKVLANVEVTQEELIAVYEENKESYIEVRAQHLLICYKDAVQCKSNRTKEEAYALAQELIIKLQEGDAFEDLAIEYSDDSSVEFNKGDLGWFTKGEMVPAFEDAVFSMSIGEVSAVPVETEYGYHIIMVTDRKDSFEDFKEQILETLTLEKQKAALEAYVAELKANAEIVYATE